ncbi:MAG: hypothetical protein ACLFT4_10705 [Bacteroidales bacterium]
MKSKYLFLKGMTDGVQDLTLEFGKIRDIDTDEFNSLIADEKLQDKLCYKIEKMLGLHKSKKCWVIEDRKLLIPTFVTTDTDIADKYSKKRDSNGILRYYVFNSKLK